MRRGAGSSTTTRAGGGAAGLWRWSLPLPYLFGGLAVTIGLIYVALIVLACTNRKPSSGGSSPPSHRGMASGGEAAPAPLDTEPNMAVIMAGDAVPSFLAKAVPSVNHAQP